MKSKKLLFSGLFMAGAFAIITTMSSTSTGITGQSVSGCGGTSCHGGVSTTAGGVITGVPLTGYVPGTTYTLTLTAGALDTSLKKAGFDVTTNGGTFSNPSTGTALSGNNEVYHTSPKSLTIGFTSWTFSWTAPSSDSVRMFISTNLVNDNGAETGDQWRNTSQAFIKSILSVNDVMSSDVSLYPNPAVNSFTIEPKHGERILSVEAISVLGGKSIVLPLSTGTRYVAQTNELSVGQYVLRIHTNEGILHSRLNIQ